jgi:hypothetical protein
MPWGLTDLRDYLLSLRRGPEKVNKNCNGYQTSGMLDDVDRMNAELEREDGEGRMEREKG